MRRRHVVAALATVAAAGASVAFAAQVTVTSTRLTVLSAPAPTTTPSVAAPVVSALTTANVSGGTAGVIENGDVTTVTFSEALDPASFCAGWDGSALAVTWKFFNSSPADTMEVHSGTCPGGGSPGLGRLALGSAAWVGNSSSTVTSTVTYSATALVVRFTATPGVALSPASSTVKLSYTPDAAMKGTGGAAVTGTFTQATAVTAW